MSNPPTMGAPLLGCTTIDSKPNDLYLAYARIGNPAAGANGSTQEAATNLQQCAIHNPAMGPANIVGHGQPGDIDTGAVLGQCMTVDNEAQWQPILQQALAGTITELFLFGCSVGAEQAGADLLFAMATTIGAPVSAPTGLIYCNAAGVFSLEDGAIWQTAQPNFQPAPVDPPVHQRGAMPKSSQETNTIQSALYLPAGTTSLSSAKDAYQLAQEVVWEKPFIPPGEPGARLTGTLIVVFASGASQTLAVYNDVLLRDMQSSSCYYATPQFKQMIETLK